MSDAVAIAMLATIGPTIIGLATLVTSIRNGSKTDNYHKEVNSRMTQLLTTNSSESRAIGKAEGIESERVRKEL